MKKIMILVLALAMLLTAVTSFAEDSAQGAADMAAQQAQGQPEYNAQPDNSSSWPREQGRRAADERTGPAG